MKLFYLSILILCPLFFLTSCIQKKEPHKSINVVTYQDEGHDDDNDNDKGHDD
jgi:major membrane immunogen (membrane-anchored lipoprotein)